ncbi:WLM domain-containing protein [Trametes gibbosa]|nr:WLM domain-containing protein [Trametes gibbosa]
MPHVRLNDSEPNPNPHISFITPLPVQDAAAEEEARQLLRALAAQVRPIMKAEGFAVNSLEEYEYNKVFAGRNWNNGELIELVLRGQGGAFQPTSWLLNCLCHELAHIKHMNHGPAFQALWTKLRNDVRDLQRKGYYGDGYWSSGTRLADSARVGGSGLDAGAFPEYMCGGAQSRTRPTSLRRRRRRQGGPGPSSHTGAQTMKRRKAGSRVTAQGMFRGSGRAMNDDVSGAEDKKAGAGFRKRAASKRAREERALAAERRLLGLQGNVKGIPAIPALGNGSDAESSGEEYDASRETDQDRRRTMLEASDQKEIEGMKTTKHDFFADFILPRGASASAFERGGSSSRTRAPKDKVINGTEQASDSGPSLPTGGPAASSSAALPGSEPIPKGKSIQRAAGRPPKDEFSKRSGLDVWLQSGSGKDRGAAEEQPSESPKAGMPQRQQPAVPYTTLVQDEIRTRTRESLGMSGAGRRLGASPGGDPIPPHRSQQDKGHSDSRPAEGNSVGTGIVSRMRDPVQGGGTTWACRVCTLENEPQHLACAACATPRGQDVWSGNSV